MMKSCVVIDTGSFAGGIATGAQAGEHGDGERVQGWDQLLRAAPNLLHPFRAERPLLFIIDRIGIGSDDGVAVRGGGDQNAFAFLGRDREKHIIDLDFGPVQDDIFAAPGVMENSGRTPALCMTTSECSPAALTTQRQPKLPRLVLTPMIRPFSMMKSWKVRCSSITVTPFWTAFSAAATAP